MVYDFSLTLMKPSKPVQTEAPDAKQIFLHAGENEAQYKTFIAAVSDLAQAFKFLPKYDQLNYKYGVPNISTDPAITAEYDESLFEFDYTNDEIFGNFSKQTEPGYGTKIWGEGLGKAFSNLDFSPDASDWDLLDGISTGSGQSFYQIAKSGMISESTYTDEQAFNLMCSMLESRERVFGALKSIFGEAEKLDAHEDLNLNGIDDVIDHISSWLDAHASVDPHNLGVLKMFFGMQTDFINTLDAYVNCETYWGGDLTTPVFSSDLGDFSETLRVKAESYISTLSGDAKTAAESLESKWFSPAPRYDKVGETWTGDLTPAKKVSDCQLAVNAAWAAYNSCAQTVYDKALAAYNTINADVNADPTALSNAVCALATAIACLTDTSSAEQATLLANLQDAQNALNDAKANYVDFEANTSGSWVEFFQDRMDEFGAKEVIRVITCHIFNRSANQKYKKEKAVYEDKKDDAIQQDIFLQRMQAKNKVANRQTFRKNIARSANVSKAIRTAGVRGSSVSARRATVAGVRMPAVIRRASSAGLRAPAAAIRGSAPARARGPVAGGTRPISGRRSPVISARPSARVSPKHFVSGPVTRRVSPRVVAAGGQGIKRPAAARPVGHIGARSGGAPAIPSKIRSAAPSVAPKPQAQAPKHSKDEKKVI